MIIWNQIKYKKVIGWWIINIGIAYTPSSIFFSLPFVFFFLLLLFFCFVYVIVAIICIQALLRVILCGSWKITCSTMVKSNLLMRANLCIICEYYNTDEFVHIITCLNSLWNMILNTYWNSIKFCIAEDKWTLYDLNASLDNMKVLISIFEYAVNIYSIHKSNQTILT